MDRRNYSLTKKDIRRQEIKDRIGKGLVILGLTYGVILMFSLFFIGYRADLTNGKIICRPRISSFAYASDMYCKLENLMAFPTPVTEENFDTITINVRNLILWGNHDTWKEVNEIFENMAGPESYIEMPYRRSWASGGVAYSIVYAYSERNFFWTLKLANYQQGVIFEPWYTVWLPSLIIYLLYIIIKAIVLKCKHYRTHCRK